MCWTNLAAKIDISGQAERRNFGHFPICQIICNTVAANNDLSENLLSTPFDTWKGQGTHIVVPWRECYVGTSEKRASP